MIDLVSEDTSDLKVFDTQTEKAGNILAIQIGDLEYAENLGIDLRYFLTSGIQFQNESFRAHLIESLTKNGVNASAVTEVIETLSSNYEIEISPQPTQTGFVR